MRKSNQGREVDQLLDDIDPQAMEEAAKATWREVQNHPAGASCRCLAIEALAVLYEAGYRVTR